MHPDTCPCCYQETYNFEYGAFEDGHRFRGSEPNEGFCSTCGFHYLEHIDHPERDQALAHREELRKSGTELDWADIEECDAVRGY